MSNDEIKKDDWRLTFQEEYLKGVELFWSTYSLYSETWDHDHCDFCWEKFSLQKDDLHEGYTTKDRYYWICELCFNDFKDMFVWVVNEEPVTEVPSP